MERLLHAGFHHRNQSVRHVSKNYRTNMRMKQNHYVDANPQELNQTKHFADDDPSLMTTDVNPYDPCLMKAIGNKQDPHA
jgi:hypothetical protein